MKRELDLIDVWFDSGSMPYAQVHYPFEHKQEVDSRQVYPADFIAEGVDQTRGWFFTLHAIGSMVFDSVAFKSVISNGLVLDKNGNKMSKRLGNAVDPFEAINKYGADAVRWYMISDENGVLDVSRKFFGTLYNTYSFFALYANVDNFDYNAPQVPYSERPEIDCWILSLLDSLVKEVDKQMEDYEPTKAARAIQDFVCDNLSNWYVRLNRKRFWGGEMDTDKLSAYQTLYKCLKTVALLMAPVAPFVADRIYRDLTGGKESVHVALYPTVGDGINAKLEQRMKMAQDITSMVLSLRRKKNLKVKQPLTQIMIPVLDEQQKQDIEAVSQLIMNEVNVKGIKFVSNEDGVLVKRVKPDFKKLGPKFGPVMKQLSKLIAGMSQKEIVEYENNGSFTFDIDGQAVTITAEDAEVYSEDIPGWLVANSGKLTVALDITVTEKLKREGVAREIVNRIQNLRKGKNFEITDRISVKVACSESTAAAITDFKSYISKQVLATEVAIVPSLEDGEEVMLDDEALKIQVEKM